MPLPGLGLNSYVGIGRETTWGSAVTVNRFHELVSFTGGLKIERTFGAAARGIQKRRWFSAKRYTDFETAFEGYYEGCEHLFKAIYNGVATTGPTNVTVYTHTFTPVVGLLAGWTVSVNKDVQTFNYTGSKANVMRMRYEIDTLAQLAVAWVGKDEVQVGNVAPTYPAEKPMRWDQTTIEVDDVAFDARAIELTIDNGLNTDRRKLGSLLIKEPARDRRMVVTGMFEADFESISDFYTKYSNDTEFKLEVINTGATIAGSSPSTSESVIHTLPRCIAVGKPIEIQGEGIIRAGLEFEAIYNVAGTADAINTVVKNAVSTVI